MLGDGLTTASPSPRRKRANRYTVIATADLPETRILKHENTFGIFDLRGDMYPVGVDELGVYHQGTRYLSRLVFRIGHAEEPLILNSTIRKDNGLLRVEMTNPDLIRPDLPPIKKGTLYLCRSKFLLESCCFDHIAIHNYGDVTVDLPMCVTFDADYRDIFEIRGMKRKRRGEPLHSEIGESAAYLSYRGLDEITRYTSISFNRRPMQLTEGHAEFKVKIPPHGVEQFEISACFREGERPQTRSWYVHGFKHLQARHVEEKKNYSGIRSTSEEFNMWVERSQDDLVMMTTNTGEGMRYPYAGIPWYCTTFGRDGIWTALQCLWANPEMARDVLFFLAKTQATEHVPEADSAPGKIIHEARSGEMANLKEIPFGSYYGSVDSTPLFILLAGEYYRRTGDRVTIESLWPNLERALGWLDRYGDPDHDGFVEYQAESARGLVHQGWKDSHDAIFHADGRDPEGPIALCEVQGYVYCAKLHLAELADLLSRPDLAKRLRREAEKLKDDFDRKFWIPEMRTYALALDRYKEPCRVNSSNAGQLFYCGIVKEERAADLAATLMADDMYSGWGIRTISTGSKRYNPISYHNGSVWPHDTAIIAMGLSRYGFKAETERIFCSMFRASAFMKLTRMPEVFCGFPRTEGDPPTLYPVACSPQAWASATVYGLVEAVLGLRLNALGNEIRFHKPDLPESIHEMRLSDLRVCDSAFDVVATRYGEDVVVRIDRRQGDANLVIEK